MSLLRGTHLLHLASLRLHVLRAYCNFKPKEVILKTLFGLCPNNKGCQWNFSEVEYVCINKVWKKLSSVLLFKYFHVSGQFTKNFRIAAVFFLKHSEWITFIYKCPGSSNCTVISHFIFYPSRSKGWTFQEHFMTGCERVPWEPWQTVKVY